MSRRTEPYCCRLCRSWGKLGDAGVTRGELADGIEYILCGACSHRLSESTGPEREQIVERIRTVVFELEILA